MTRPLPLFDLEPNEFEYFCFRLIDCDARFQKVIHTGRAGQDRGRDITAEREGETFFFQCKSCSNFYPSDAKEVVSDALRYLDSGQRANLVILVAADGVTPKCREAASRAWSETGQCEIWARSELDALARSVPEIVEQFFPGELVRSCMQVQASDAAQVTEREKARAEQREHWRRVLTSRILAIYEILILGGALLAPLQFLSLGSAPPSPLYWWHSVGPGTYLVLWLSAGVVLLLGIVRPLFQWLEPSLAKTVDRFWEYSEERALLARVAFSMVTAFLLAGHVIFVATDIPYLHAVALPFFLVGAGGAMSANGPASRG